jgi:hypothetical protein
MKLLRSISVKIQYLLWAISRIRKPHVGDIVKYQGHWCVLIRGSICLATTLPKQKQVRNAGIECRSTSWELLPCTKRNLKKNTPRKIKFVHVSHFIMRPLIFRFIPVICQDFRYQMQNWYGTDMKRIGLISYNL